MKSPSFPDFLYTLFFVNLKSIGNNRNINPEYPTNHSRGASSNSNKNYRNEKVSAGQS